MLDVPQTSAATSAPDRSCFSLAAPAPRSRVRTTPAIKVVFYIRAMNPRWIFDRWGRGIGKNRGDNRAVGASSR